MAAEMVFAGIWSVARAISQINRATARASKISAVRSVGLMIAAHNNGRRRRGSRRPPSQWSQRLARETATEQRSRSNLPSAVPARGRLRFSFELPNVIVWPVVLQGLCHRKRSLLRRRFALAQCIARNALRQRTGVQCWPHSCLVIHSDRGRHATTDRSRGALGGIQGSRG